MKRIGEIALQLGIIEPHQLQHALNLQRSKYKNLELGKVLFILGYVNERELATLEEQISREKEKRKICLDWIDRYTGIDHKDFGKFIIFTNFIEHLEIACQLYNCDLSKLDKKLMYPAVRLSDDIMMVSVHMGSPNMALAVDVFSAIDPSCFIFIGKCGGIKRYLQIGDFILPTSAIRGEGTSDDYLDHNIPALPAFSIQYFLAQQTAKQDQAKYFTGVVHTTNRRLWEFDEDFCLRIVQEKVIAIEMETATFFTVSFANGVPCGALLLVSDLPLAEVKTKEKDKVTSKKFSEAHVKIACSTIEQVKENVAQLKHFSYGAY